MTMPARTPYKRFNQSPSAAAQHARWVDDPMSVDARQAANQRGPYDYLKPRPRYDGIVQSDNFPGAQASNVHKANPLVVNTLDTTLTPTMDKEMPRGLLRNAWPAFKDVSAPELEKRALGLMDTLERDGLHFQALTVGEHEGKPQFLLYLDRALRANTMVPDEHDGIPVQRMTVGKFKR